MRIKRILSTFILLTAAGLVQAQHNKKTLDHQVYDKWQSISSESISKNGLWIAYTVTPQQGDATLFICNRQSGKKIAVPRGDESFFTDDGRHTVFLIKPPYAETRAARIKKKKPSEMPKDSLCIVENATGSTRKFPNVSSFQLASQNSGIIAYQLEPAATKADDKKDPEEEEPRGKAGKARDRQAADVVLLDLKSGHETKFPHANEYLLSSDGRTLALCFNTEKAGSSQLPHVSIYDLSTSKSRVLTSGNYKYTNMAFDQAGKQLAFNAAAPAKARAAKKSNALYYYSSDADSAIILIDNKSKGMPECWQVSADAKLRFSHSGRRIFFGTAPQTSPKDTTIVDFEVAKLDIWNYKDDYLQPFQLQNREKELKRSYLAVADPREKGKLIQLADERCPQAETGNKGDADYALASSNFGHRVETQWTGSGAKALFLISLRDGSRKQISAEAQGRSYLSPLGNHVVWFSAADTAWHTYNIRNSASRVLTAGLGVPFADELNDLPDMPDAYGISAFSADDRQVLVYDRYDIWKISLDKVQAENLTAYYGRKNNITFRYHALDTSREDRKPEETAVVYRGQILYLDAFSNSNKEAGWYQAGINKAAAPKKIVMGPFSYSRPFASKGSSLLIYRKENYRQSPDLYVSSGFRDEKKLSDLNPWQQDYNWGSAELFKWTTDKGNSSEGILYKPENFDPAKSYPMIVYFYEKLSDKLFQYIAPAPTPSRLNISYFVSNGYLVFAPDISYRTGHPGASAEEYINSGVEALKRNSWVNAKKIGIQGQSWGGYQVAHLITRTDKYAAAWAGAPVVNMFSAYGGIRWESGLSRQFQYEKTQSRIGATIWDKPELYIENSPLFHMPRVNTPVVIMANDADGAVPWYQGIEMFTALRRLNKPVWLLNYNNEAHNLVQRQNRKDIQRREQQFFDHFLKDAPMPEWLDKGVPATEKGKNWGFQLTPEK